MDYFCCDVYINTAPAAASRGELDTWLARLASFIAKHTAGFVWNREPLQLFVDTRSK
ncbi:hypothetical protein IWQ56_001105, partial [Coemansia nantahalensis]